MILLDPDRDHRSAFQLVIDHRGRVWDGVGNDPGWDPQWFVAGDETERTWSIEAAIPLAQLGVKHGAAQSWWGSASSGFAQGPRCDLGGSSRLSASFGE
ncbi:MAG: hypothetical protein R3B96_21770 [Pirellulaceae bacterium]